MVFSQGGGTRMRAEANLDGRADWLQPRKVLERGLGVEVAAGVFQGVRVALGVAESTAL